LDATQLDLLLHGGLSADEHQANTFPDEKPVRHRSDGKDYSKPFRGQRVSRVQQRNANGIERRFSTDALVRQWLGGIGEKFKWTHRNFAPLFDIGCELVFNDPEAMARISAAGDGP
jgi:hypothetical protein